MNILSFFAPTIALSGAMQPAPVSENRAAIIETTGSRRSSAKLALPRPTVVLLCTEFVGSSQERRLRTCEDCSSLYYESITVLRLRDVFSDGTARTYSRTVGG